MRAITHSSLHNFATLNRLAPHLLLARARPASISLRSPGHAPTVHSYHLSEHSYSLSHKPNVREDFKCICHKGLRRISGCQCYDEDGGARANGKPGACPSHALYQSGIDVNHLPRGRRLRQPTKPQPLYPRCLPSGMRFQTEPSQVYGLAKGSYGIRVGRIQSC